MRRIKTTLLAAALLMGCASASAQYWTVANQATNMITSALNAGFNYRGFVDASYLAGLGNRRADFLEFSTTQGAQYSNWFFMGLGLGVDVMFCHVNDGIPDYGYVGTHDTTKTGVAIPVFSDFRFNFGDNGTVGFFADIRLGAAFLCGSDYIQVGDGYLTNSESFYFRPTIGMRVPVSSANSKLAFNIGISYQLMTNSSWYVNNNSTTLNALGVNLGFEW